jgi:hypothetical protein
VAKKPAAAKVATTKAATAKTAATKTASKISKGDAYLCEVCGLGVNVDVCGDFLETTALYCCDKAMKKKTGIAKVAKK